MAILVQKVNISISPWFCHGFATIQAIGEWQDGKAHGERSRERDDLGMAGWNSQKPNVEHPKKGEIYRGIVYSINISIFSIIQAYIQYTYN